MDEKIIIDVEISTEEASKQLSNTITEIDRLKQESKELKQAMAENGDESGKLGKAYALAQQDIKALKNKQKELTNIIQVQTNAWEGYGTSLDEQRRKLNDMLHTYDSLQAEYRDSSAGRQLLQQINEQTKAVRELEQATGRHQRNVGNYPSAISGIIPYFDNIIGKLGTFGVSLDSLSTQGVKAFSSLGNGAKAFGKVMLTPPIALIVVALSAILAIFNKVSEAIKKNDDASTNLQKAYSALQPIVTGISQVFDRLAVFITSVILKFSDFSKSVINFLSNLGLVSKEYGKIATASADLAEATDKLQERERQYTRNSAKNALEVSKLKVQAQEKEKYSASEREKMLKRAIEIETAELNERRAIAKEKARLIKLDAKLRVDTSDATKDKIAQADAEVYKAEEAYYNGVRTLYKGVEKTHNEVRASETARYNEAKQRQKERESEEARAEQERIKREAESIKIRERLEDEMAMKIEDEYERREAQETLRYNREIDSLMAQREQWEENSQEYANINQLIENEALRHSEEMNRITQEQITNELIAYNEQREKEQEIEKNKLERIKKINEANVIAIRSAYSSVMGLLDQFGRQNKGLAIASKAMALGQIAVESGVAIAKGIAQSQSVPFPANIASIATTIATILSNISQATSMVQSAKFAEGGIVGGNSYEGDKIPVQVNSREGIFTIEQQKQLFDIANGRKGANVLDYDRLTESLTEALKTMPNPVLEYSEFAKFEQNVVNLNELTKL